MKTKINRIILIMPDQSKNIIWPKVKIEDVEKYRADLLQLTGAVKILFDREELDE